MINADPATLDADELKAALQSLREKKGQTHRMVRYLAKNPKSSTAFVASDCAIGNVSDCAIRANESLYKADFFISCQRPHPAIQNRFGEPSAMFLWSLYRLPEAANEAVR